MGKGNRSRIERAMADSANTSKNVKANKNKVSGAGIFVAIAAVLVVVALLIGAIGVLNDGGWFARSQTVVKTDNFSVNGAMMNYFFNTQFNNYYQSYYQLYSQFASSGTDISSTVYKQMGISDPDKSLKDQNMPAKEGEETVTVFDYYMGLTEDYVTRMLTYCEFAVKENIALDDEDYEEIDHTLEHLKESYESQKAMYEQFGMAYYTTFSAYLSATYGTGVKERDIRNCLELITLAAEFEEALSEDKEAEILSDETREAIEDYVKANPSNFLMADYYTYSFSVSSKNYNNDADFEAAKKETLDKAKKLAEAQGKDAYKAAVLELLKESELASYRSKNFETFLKENDNDKDQAEEALVKSFNEKIWTEAKQNETFEKLLTVSFKCPSTATDLSKWIFGYDAGEHTDDCTHEGEHEEDKEAAKEGDVTYIESTKETEETVKKETTAESTTAETTVETTTEAAAAAAETTTAETTTAAGTTSAGSSSTSNKVKVTTYTVSVYLLDRAAYRNTEITKHFGYVMFSEKDDAEAFYAEYSKGEMNKDTMLELVEDMHEEVSVYAYDSVEDYLLGDLEDQNIDTADKWLKEAKPGDCSGVIEVVRTTTTSSSSSSSSTTEKKTTYYAVLVYDQEGYEAWFCDALAGATSEAVGDWYEENDLDLTYNGKAYVFINV